MIISFYIGATFLVAGLIQGLTGFGSALVALPLLALFLDIKTAVPLCVLASIIINSHLTLQLKNHVKWKMIAPLIVSSIPGIVIGSKLLKEVDGNKIETSIGLFLVIYSLFHLTVSPRPRQLRRIWGWVAGFCSGMMGSVFGINGPPAIIYATLNNWTKDEIKVTLTSFFLFNSCLITIVHAFSGIVTFHLSNYLLVAIPFILIGTHIGFRLYYLVPDTRYKQLVHTFLLIMGGILLF